MEQSFTQADYLEGLSPGAYLTEEKLSHLVRLRERIFYLKDTGITPRLFNVWKSQGLVDLPIALDKRSWVKLSFCDYLWIRVIDDLRSFGCSIEDIKKVKSACLQDILELSSKHLSEEQIRQSFIKTLKDNTDIPQEQKDRMYELLTKTNTPVFKILKEETGDYLTTLEMMVLNLLHTRSDASLVIVLTPGEDTDDGKVLVKQRSKRRSRILVFFYSEEFKKLNFPVPTDMIFKLPHIKLPLARYVADFILQPENEKRVESLNLISKDELTLLKEMRKGGISKVTIYFSQDRIKRIDITKPMEKMEQARLVETFLKNEFVDIEYTAEKGQIVKFQKTIKIKPN
jgi:DNA-binding transcriptional MerR regulator